MFNLIFADDWIRTMDLWHRKQSLYQLSYNHCPKFVYDIDSRLKISFQVFCDRDGARDPLGLLHPQRQGRDHEGC